MITKLHLKNFRGISEAVLDIAPITVLTGANNTGKSSIMYGLLTLKNVVSNPNQPLDSFFNFLFINLGGFKETVHLKEEEARTITLQTESRAQKVHSAYGIVLGKSHSSLQVTEYEPADLSLRLDVSWPYPLNLNTGLTLGEEYGSAKISWNGITPTISTEKADGVDQDKVKRIATALTLPVDDINRIDFVPLKRGFVKPIFSPVPLQPQLITEDEIATYLANDRDLEARVNFYLEKIVNKNFQARPTLGTANFYLHTTDRQTGFLCDLVNDGFGTNQLVYLLVKALRKESSTICVEEPEIHLHPDALIKLVGVLIEIARQRGRNFIISTHSEHFVLSLLNRLVHQTIAPQDVKIYYVRKDRARTIAEEQHVTAKGQIEGGLKAFYETELEQMRDFLGIKEPT